MSDWGMLVTAAVSLAGAAAFFAAARATRRSSKHASTTTFYALLCGFLGAAGGRLVFGFAGLQPVDEAMFYVAGICAYASIVPLSFTAYFLVSGKPRVAWVAAGLHAIPALLGVGAMFAGGLVAQSTTFWATEWKMAAPLAGLALLFGILLPALVAGTGILLTARHIPRNERGRVLSVGWSVLVVYLALTTDGLATFGGEVLVVERLMMAVAGLVVARSYGFKWTSRDAANVAERA